MTTGYDSRLMEASGLPPTLFPDIVPSTYIIGEIAKDVSEVIGLSNRVKVVCGGVDNSCMALGAGNITEGRLYLSLGSSAWIAVSSHGPIVDVKIKPFVFTHVIPEMFTSATAIFSAGNSLKWVRDTLCKDIKEVAERENRDPYEMMPITAEESPIGAHKLIFNPSLAGGSAAHLSPQIQGAFLGIDLSHTQADVRSCCGSGTEAIRRMLKMQISLQYLQTRGYLVRLRSSERRIYSAIMPRLCDLAP